MTSSEIRQSFLDFFKSKGHTLVPSSSLLPDSPNLLFTNAGMNQFVPIFLGQRAPDVNKWPGAAPGLPTRAADTQKCIRAGGKHNDLEDVGFDTYHHTFFEMLGNWSFGDYFKTEAIPWAWELITEVWKFPKARLYVTVYKPGPGEPASFDQEAYDLWAPLFERAGLDPKAHILFGGKKDNFWMMGDTGPCGPCSEIHVDLTPAGDTQGRLVNEGSPRCIEIWNLVFIQFNANPDGSFSPLPARHVDTGMGFERVTGILQNTKQLTDFSRPISNYQTDIFQPLFQQLEQLSGKRYHSSLPQPGAAMSEQEKIDVAFRVIADHIRTLSFAIADGIQPGNNDRHYVLRRILRRAVRYGRSLGFHQPFFYKLVDVLAENMGHVFPEIRTRQQLVKDTIRLEEDAFNKTLDRGLELFEEEIRKLQANKAGQGTPAGSARILPGSFAFLLYDTYGFPVDLTEVMARERGYQVEMAEFERLMDAQRARARKAQKKVVIKVSDLETTTPTRFTGYDALEGHSKVLEVLNVQDKPAVVLNETPCYPEGGGQVADTGELIAAGQLWRVQDVRKTGEAILHFLAEDPGTLEVGSEVRVAVDPVRRLDTRRHHTVTHLLHWALHEAVSPELAQKGSYVGPDKLTFDFNSAPLTADQLATVERLVNERILENAPVSWMVVPFAEVRSRRDIRQFFGEKYGDQVRVVQLGGRPRELDGFSMELCGGTHAFATGELGFFRITGEAAIASGIRRIEALTGWRAFERTHQEAELLGTLAGKVNSPLGELEKKIESLLTQQKEMEKLLKSIQQRESAETAKQLLHSARSFQGLPGIVHNVGTADGDTLQAIADGLKGQFKGAIVLGGAANGAVALVAAVTPDFVSKVQAGKLIQQIAPVVGGRGGGRPDNARGGGKLTDRLDEALQKAIELLEAAGAKS